MKTPKPRHYTAAMSRKLLMIEDDARLAQMVANTWASRPAGHAPGRWQKWPGAIAGSPETGPCPTGDPGLMPPDMDGSGSVSPHPLAARPCRPGAGADAHRQGDPMDRIIGLELGADDLPKTV